MSHLETTPLGRTGEAVTKLGFGAMELQPRVGEQGFGLVVIGASTGGPPALQSLFQNVPWDKRGHRAGRAVNPVCPQNQLRL